MEHLKNEKEFKELARNFNEKWECIGAEVGIGKWSHTEYPSIEIHIPDDGSDIIHGTFSKCNFTSIEDAEDWMFVMDVICEEHFRWLEY